MTVRERLLAVCRKRGGARIPWAVYDIYLPQGDTERELRDGGCGIIKRCPVASLLPPAPIMSSGPKWIYEPEVRKVQMCVRVVWRGGRRVLVRSYETPFGTVSQEILEDTAYGSPWIKKFFIRSVRDYDVIRFIAENTEPQDLYELFATTSDILGNDGVVMAAMDRSPWQKMLFELVGAEHLYLDLQDNPRSVEALLTVLQEKELEACRLAAESRAEIVWIPDNITGALTPPRLFELYCMPFYNQCARLLHKKGKLLAVHMDGKLACLKELIAKTEIDVIESLTPPEGGGDVSVSEAGLYWKDKSIGVGFPAVYCFKGRTATKRYLNELIEQMPGKERFFIEISEDLPKDGWADTLQEIMHTLKGT